jgi:hypothetical protein
MIINDLEFFNSCDREYQKDDVAILGGASSSSTSSNNNGKTYASISVSEGDDSYSLVMDGDKIIKKYGKGGCNYKVGDSYTAYYELKGYDLVSYSSIVN